MPGVLNLRAESNRATCHSNKQGKGSNHNNLIHRQFYHQSILLFSVVPHRMVAMIAA